MKKIQDGQYLVRLTEAVKNILDTMNWLQRLTKKLSRKYHTGKQTLDDSLGIYRLE